MIELEREKGEKGKGEQKKGKEEEEVEVGGGGRRREKKNINIIINNQNIYCDSPGSKLLYLHFWFFLERILLSDQQPSKMSGTQC